MTSLFTKRKIFVIAMCVFLVSFSTAIFLAGEKHFIPEYHSNDLQAYILHPNDIEETKNEIFYRNFLNNHQDDIFILKQDTTIELVSEHWRKQFGYENPDIVDQNFFTFIHPKDLPFFANIFIEIVQTNEKKEGIGPFRMKDINGQYKLFIATGIPMKNEKGEIIEIAVILRDVSTPIGSESGETSFEEIVKPIDEFISQIL